MAAPRPLCLKCRAPIPRPEEGKPGPKRKYCTTCRPPAGQPAAGRSINKSSRNAADRAQRNKSVVTSLDRIITDGLLTKHELKDRYITELLRGHNMGQAARLVGRSRRTVEIWRQEDPEFSARVQSLLAKRAGEQYHDEHFDPQSLTFEEWSARYMRQSVFPHIGNAIDLIEGREPRWTHPAMAHTMGERDLVVINYPPEHGKSTSLTINYVTYRICMDPSVRIVIVSKATAMARKMLLAVRSRLTSPKYADLIRDYAPPGGFDTYSDSWTADMIYVAGRDVESKDPTVQALGVRGHLYGARADLIIMDDCVDLSNAHEHAKQIDWIESEVQSRIAADGTLLVVGTRLAARDLYSELLDPTRYTDGVNPWTYLAMPAVLQYADDEADWITLWPATDVHERGLTAADQRSDGLWPKWDGPRLARKRARVKPATWARVYQQQQVAEDTVFDPEDIKGCTNGARKAGRIPAGMSGGVREEGMSGLLVLAGLDPATTGYTAAAVVGLDPATGRRYVLDVRNLPALGNTPDLIRNLIYELTTSYDVLEWVIETNGFQGFLAHDREVNAFLASRGAIVRPHYTSAAAKRDPDFGVAAMNGLFRGWREGHNLIELPGTRGSEGVKALVEQLVTWQPAAPKSLKTDTVMALWMAELACQRRLEMLGSMRGSHRRSPFLSRAEAAAQHSINIADIEWRALA